ncbi:unnamed protein product [Caenorhabditis auriculariae]|uniref:Uncharacterized protein n=1 Tax=Caenorhabditis auriculariae TaxID=2777116 RepID=A0A8S1H6Q6_9PELO|nr:unnamed protein product [Caenorhabditis auriculariae]
MDVLEVNRLGRLVQLALERLRSANDFGDRLERWLLVARRRLAVDQSEDNRRRLNDLELLQVQHNGHLRNLLLDVATAQVRLQQYLVMNVVQQLNHEMEVPTEDEGYETSNSHQ